jgi:hypothetical protein
VDVPRDRPGGNTQHFAPEVLHALKRFDDHRTTKVVVDYSGQATFEAGVLLWEVATGQHPIQDYHSATAMPPALLICSQAPLLFRAGYPEEFVGLICDMVREAPRPELSVCFQRFVDAFSLCRCTNASRVVTLKTINDNLLHSTVGARCSPVPCAAPTLFVLFVAV